MSTGIYTLSLIISIFYSTITKKSFAVMCSLFSLFSLFYTLMSLEACFPGSSPTKNLVDITLLNIFGILASIFYTLNIEYILPRSRKVTLLFRRFIYILLLIIFISLILFLVTGKFLFLKFSNIEYLNPILINGMGGIEFTTVGEIILGSEVCANIILFVSLIYLNFSVIKKERLLFIGLTISLIFIFNDNALGITQNQYLFPLMAIGLIPEIIRFLKYIVTQDYLEKLEYSNRLIESLQHTHKSRILSQLFHDYAKENQAINKNVMDLEKFSKSQLSVLNNNMHLKKVNVLDVFNFTKEVFDRELKEKNIEIKLNCCVCDPIEFSFSDLYIIFSNLIQNTLMHSNGDVISLELKRGAIETQIIYSDNGTNIPKDFKNQVFSNKNFQINSEGCMGYGLMNARNAAIANNSFFEYIGNNISATFRLRIVE